MSSEKNTEIIICPNKSSNVISWIVTFIALGTLLLSGFNYFFSTAEMQRSTTELNEANKALTSSKTIFNDASTKLAKAQANLADAQKKFVDINAAFKKDVEEPLANSQKRLTDLDSRVRQIDEMLKKIELKTQKGVVGQLKLDLLTLSTPNVSIEGVANPVEGEKIVFVQYKLTNIGKIKVKSVRREPSIYKDGKCIDKLNLELGCIQFDSVDTTSGSVDTINPGQTLNKTLRIKVINSKIIGRLKVIIIHDIDLDTPAKSIIKDIASEFNIKKIAENYTFSTSLNIPITIK